MDVSFPMAALVGTVLGFLSGLGVGGGSLLILWLTLGLKMQPEEARAINLMFFLPAAGISVIFRQRQGAVQIHRLTGAIVSGCLAAVLFSKLGQRLPVDLLRRLFGVLLLATGIREITYRPREFK